MKYVLVRGAVVAHVFRVFAFSILTNISFASVFVLPESGQYVGETQLAYSRIGETLGDVGRRFHIGYVEMVRANPQVNPQGFLPHHTRLNIPSQFKLPKGPRRGIVINLAAFRLFYYVPNEPIVLTFPVGIGREGWDTPLGETRITAKIMNPEWHPTPQILKEAMSKGELIPEYVPPGPNNPLGTRALRLAWPAVLIHGSHSEEGIGTRVSAGCIRMLTEDMEQLFDLVAVGTSVRVFDEWDKTKKG